jgi:3-hydroxy acid dehydrogenase / malonic semialdehyde reductase
MSVFISGASAGIGEACARAFAAAKHDLVLVARRKERLEKLAQELKSEFKVQVHTFECDVQNRKSVEALFQKDAAVMKTVDILLNNAGLAVGRGPIQDGNPDDWDTMFDTNVKGLLYVTHAFLPQMIAAKGGHIINMGSAAGHWVYPNGNIYCATKYAVHALTQALRVDTLGSGIRVTEISPGMVESDFSKVRFKGDMDKVNAIYQGITPLTPVDVAETVLWCASRPAHVNIQDVVMFPTAQASVEHAFRRK